EVLENTPDRLPQPRDPTSRHLGDIEIGHRDLTIGGNLLTQQQTQERRLSGAGRADEEDELTLVDLHGDVVQRGARRRLVRLGNVVEPDHDSIPYLRSALNSGCL